ncbi:type VII secretion protein EccB [Streptomyces sp. NPDC018031]|uniref:type VII secretion protein EccB n=1 Tax=Streptomyces sp. NPDC018031 TaxID=3365033 RepID=UPI0037A0C5FA
MASRRDELNAYTYAKKRLVAAFLQPSPAGTEEGAPRPLRAVLPGLVIGALILAGFGAWGMFKPKAPKGWDAPATNVIIGSKSTTRYVVLKTNGKAQLHPVLNLASAKLLLDPGKGKVIKVDEKVLDNGDLPHGPTLGIPYAPDRLPSPGDAGQAKRWAVCQQPGGHGTTVQEATFVFAEREAEQRTDGSRRLRGGQVLYVESERTKARYIVDAGGTKYLVSGGQWRRHAPAATAGDNDLLLKAVVGDRSRPQRVTDDWLATLHDGDPITFPEVPGPFGSRAGVAGLDPDEDRVGMVLRTETGAGPQQYVVLPGRVAPVSDFAARLLLGSDESNALDQAGHPKGVDPSATRASGAPFADDRRWPQQAAEQVNAATGAGARDTVCSVLRDVSGNGTTRLSTWAGTGFPATIVEGGSRTYVTPGTGLLYRQVSGSQSETGSLFLVTDTGLRYAVQNNNDSSAEKSRIGTAPSGDTDETREGEARIRLGYRDVEPPPVPATWSQFLSRGPRLDRNSAQQPQGS